MFFKLGGCLDAPHIGTPLYVHTPPIHSYTPQACTHPPYAPILLCASVCSWRLCMLWGLYGAPFCVRTLPYTTPVWGASPSFAPPTLSCWFPVHWYLLGISVCHLGIFPLCWGFKGVPQSVGGFGGINT